jgi:threonine/homoserine/homoserine lactone efflux protein
MEGSLLLTLVTLHFVALISPGPDFTLIVHHANQYGRKIGYWIALGLGIGIACHSLLSLTGISLLIQQHPMAPWILKTLGGAYLVYLGIKIFLTLKRTPKITEIDLNLVKPHLTACQALKRGLTANLLNPKAMLFFMGLMSSMVPPQLAWSDQALITALLGGSGILWFVFLSSLFGHPKAQQKLLRWQRPLDAICATALIVMGSAFLLN